MPGSKSLRFSENEKAVQGNQPCTAVFLFMVTAIFGCVSRTRRSVLHVAPQSRDPQALQT